MSNQSTVERCPHDRENPYIMVSKYVFYANLLTIECRYIYMHLSNLHPNSTTYKEEISLVLGIPVETVESSLAKIQEMGWLTPKQVEFLFGGE